MNWFISLLTKLDAILIAIFVGEKPIYKDDPPTETMPQEPTPSVHTSKLKEWALAAQDFEGWFLPKTFHDGKYYPFGSSSYAHNNPGNCKDLHGEFIHFKTSQAGFDYLCNYFTRAATGQHRAYPKGGLTTLNEFYHIYTGDKEPSPTNYGIAIAKACGVTPQTEIKDLL